MLTRTPKKIILSVILLFVANDNVQENKELIGKPKEAESKQAPILANRKSNHVEKFPEIFTKLATLRKGRQHLSHLNLQEENEINNLELAESVFKQARYLEYSEQEESSRMRLLDYLGEKYLGRLSTDYPQKVYEILKVQLDEIPETLPIRQRKSLLGDQVEIIMWMTRKDPHFTIRLWKSQRNPNIAAAWRVGVQNGLWQIGYSSREQEAFLQ